MPLDISTSTDFLKTRVDKTLSVQRQIAATWTWPLKTLEQWETDSIQLDKSQPDSVAAKAIDAFTRADSVRGVIDARLKTMHEHTLAVVGVMRVRAKNSPAHSHVVDELSARGDSRTVIEKEGTDLLSAWKEEFGQSFAPAPGITFAGFQTLFYGDATATPPVPSLRDLKQALSDAVTIERRETGRLHVMLNRVGAETVDWYAEATAVFPAGTETGDLIRSDIPTTDQYNPSTATPAGPAQPA